MNSLKTLTNNITTFITNIAEHCGESISEVQEALGMLNFYSLYQTLRRKARPVYTYHAGSGKDNLMVHFMAVIMTIKLLVEVLQIKPMVAMVMIKLNYTLSSLMHMGKRGMIY